MSIEKEIRDLIRSMYFNNGDTFSYRTTNEYKMIIELCKASKSHLSYIIKLFEDHKYNSYIYALLILDYANIKIVPRQNYLIYLGMTEVYLRTRKLNKI